jgi:hypothetical protein
MNSVAADAADYAQFLHARTPRKLTAGILHSNNPESDNAVVSFYEEQIQRLR